MPTFETLPRFTTDLQHLTPAQRRRFHHVVLDSFVPDLRTGLFRPGLRIKGLRAAPGIFGSPGHRTAGRHGSTARRRRAAAATSSGAGSAPTRSSPVPDRVDLAGHGGAAIRQFRLDQWKPSLKPLLRAQGRAEQL